MTIQIAGRIMTVLIAGGGIGGLTLALSLHQIGVPARVFESVPELKPLGVGINVLPHAVRELIELGLHDRLDASAVRTHELAYFSKHGKPIWSEPRGIEAGYKWPQFSIHRGTLQQILLDAAIERLGRENILTSHHLTGWTETTDGIRAEFIDRATGKSAGSHEGELLIAADGIHSAVREKLYPREGPPIWNGRILWRGITTSDAFLTGRTMIMAGHEMLKFVCYPISRRPMPAASIKSTGSPSGTCRRPTSGAARIIIAPRSSKNFCRCSSTGIRLARRAQPDPQLPARLRVSAGRPRSDPAMDLWPRHADGRCRASDVSIGSNGASQAILDARVLTREILAKGPTGAALAAYEAERRPATSDLVMLNRRNGPEQVMQLVEERAPDGYNVVTDVLSLKELEDIAANYKRVAGFQVEGLNAKPPIVHLPGTRRASAG